MKNLQEPYVITIGRQTGSGGKIIANALAKRLGIAYYDKDILSQAAEETGLGRNVFHRTSDKRSFFNQFMGAVQPFFGGGDFYGSQLSDESIYSLQSALIKRLASEHSCVFLGRTADSVLADHPRRIRLFISASESDRIRHIMDEKKLDFKAAAHYVKENDELRSGYYNFYANTNWGSAESYDLCINSTLLGLDGTTDFLYRFVTARLGIATDETPQTDLPELF